MLQGEHSEILLTFIKLPFVIKIFVLSFFEWPFTQVLLYLSEEESRPLYITLSYDVASGSEITPCNKIDKPLVGYRLTGNVMTSITTLRT